MTTIETRRVNVGFRVYTEIERADPAAIELLRDLDPLTVADAMHGFGLMDAGIAPVFRPMPTVIGPAVTVKVTPGDGLMLRQALALAREGDIIVVDGAGEVQRAVSGGNCCIDMLKKGILGLIVDGAVRDVAEARGLGTPVFARAPTGRPGTTLAGRGEVNVPVSCGGVVVMPGDCVIASEEAVVVVPRADVHAVIARTREIEAVKGRFDQLAQRVEAARSSPHVHGHGQQLPDILRREGATIIEGAWSP